MKMHKNNITFIKRIILIEIIKNYIILIQHFLRKEKKKENNKTIKTLKEIKQSWKRKKKN